MIVKCTTGAIIFLLGGTIAASCFYDTNKDPVDVQDTSDSADGGIDGGEGEGNVSGTVAIVQGLDQGSYAIADLYLLFLAECPSGALEVETFGVFVEPDLDFSVPGATRVFAINGAPAGLTYLWAFLDSNDSVQDTAAPQPDNPDAIASSCAEVDLASGATLTDLELTLDVTIPAF